MAPRVRAPLPDFTNAPVLPEPRADAKVTLLALVSSVEAEPLPSTRRAEMSSVLLPFHWSVALFVTVIEPVDPRLPVPKERMPPRMVVPPP